MKEQHLLNELKELREEMQRIQTMSAKKYERLLREKDDEKNLRISAEKRNEELSLEISSSTQPLLRQMESLKNSHIQKKKIWENLESELRKRIRNLENELNNKDAKINKILTDLEDMRIIESKMDIVSTRLKEENKSLKIKLNDITDKYEEIQIKYDDMLSEYDMNKNKNTNLENDKKGLQQQLIKFNKDYENERNRLQNILSSENKKRQELQKTITILQNKLRQFESYGAVTNININAGRSSTPATPNPDTTDDNLKQGSISPRNSADILFGAVTTPTGTDNNINSNNMWTISRIQNELRQKENELLSLKQRLIRIESTNDKFSDEIVRLKSQNETLSKYQNLYRNQSKQINALRLRYEAAIDIVMEKEKQIQQLSQR